MISRLVNIWNQESLSLICFSCCKFKLCVCMIDTDDIQKTNQELFCVLVNYHTTSANINI